MSKGCSKSSGHRCWRVLQCLTAWVALLLYFWNLLLGIKLPKAMLSNSSTTTSASNPSVESPSVDWFRRENWQNSNITKDCWYVEDLCHSSHRWFYHPSLASQHQQDDDNLHPPFSLVVYQESKSAGGHPSTLTVTSLSDNRSDEDLILLRTNESASTSCHYSPIPNHLVIQSAYNNMLGEFYSRSIMFLHAMQQSVIQQDNHSDQQNNFMEQTQLYLHVMRGFPQHAKLLDSHHLFTDPFRSNPLLSFTSLLDYTGCRCLKRLFLCGYDVTTTASATNSTTAAAADSKTVELVPKGNPGLDHMQRDHANIFRDVRERLLRTVIRNNPFIQQDVRGFRADAIERHGQPEGGKHNFTTSNTLQEFRIVGRTQRRQRRQWLNLADILHLCNTEWFSQSDRIVCIELNIEHNDVNPVRQVVMHAACDMIIGIHGAQLTEAIWMNDGSVVVELLPWIHDGARYGDWTRTTHRPTPLGSIFSERPLNHIGSPLQRDSVPYCLNKDENLVERDKCLDRFSWESRNFQVEPRIVHDMITKLAPVKHMARDNNVVSSISHSCEEWRKKAGRNVYVLYNIYCCDAGDETLKSNCANPVTRHFYWPRPRSRAKRSNKAGQ